MSLYIEALRFIPCSYDLFIPVSELPIYDLFIPVSKKCQHFHTIKCVKMYEVTHHRLMGARCKTPFRKAMVRQRFRTWFCWGLRPSFDLFIPVYTSSLDLRPHVQCHSIFWAFCPVFNYFRVFFFCPVFNLTSWPGQGPKSALWDQIGPKVPIWSLPRSCTLRCNLVVRTHVRHLFGSARFVKRKKAVLLKSSSVSNCKSSQNLKSSRIQLAFHVVFFYTAEVKGFWRNRRKVQMVRIEVINFTSLSQGVCISTSDEFWKPHQCMCRWLTSVIPHRYLMVVRYEFYLRKQASTDAIECCVTKAK